MNIIILMSYFKMESKTFKCCACLFTSILIFSRGQCNEIEFCEEVASVCENFPNIKHTLKEITEMCLQKLKDEAEATKYSVSKPFEFKSIGKMMDDVVKTLNLQRSSTVIKKTKAPDKSLTKPKHEMQHNIKYDGPYFSAELSSTERQSTAIPQHYAATAIFKEETVLKENQTSPTNTESVAKNVDQIRPTYSEYNEVIPEPEIDIPLEEYDLDAKFESRITTSKSIASTTLVYEKVFLKPKDETITKNETTREHDDDFNVSTSENNGSSVSKNSNSIKTKFTTPVNIAETTDMKENRTVLYTDESQQYGYDPLLRYNESIKEHKGQVTTKFQTGPPEALTTAGFNSKLLWCLVFLAATLIAFTVPVLYKRTKKRLSGSHDLEGLEVQYTP